MQVRPVTIIRTRFVTYFFLNLWKLLALCLVSILQDPGVVELRLALHVVVAVNESHLGLSGVRTTQAYADQLVLHERLAS